MMKLFKIITFIHSKTSFKYMAQRYSFWARQIEIKNHYVYYSDHDGILVNLKEDTIVENA